MATLVSSLQLTVLPNAESGSPPGRRGRRVADGRHREQPVGRKDWVYLAAYIAVKYTQSSRWSRVSCCYLRFLIGRGSVVR